MQVLIHAPKFHQKCGFLLRRLTGLRNLSEAIQLNPCRWRQSWPQKQPCSSYHDDRHFHCPHSSVLQTSIHQNYQSSVASDTMTKLLLSVYSKQIMQLLPTTLEIQVEQLVGVCVCVCGRTLSFQQHDLCPRYLARWFILTLNSSVKIQAQIFIDILAA